ncbi:MAG: 4-(cytidine 5'-diphospho)-2-C-methyl-D-erythritol kinase [Treponema sp.]|nr:4-(cytidine 5'-diphospho)-2-C-methyl-D-erythritol kinase [Treponema sp.]
MTLLAPAKLNLGLKVFARRPDGFHALESVFTTVALYDEVTVTLSDKKNICTVMCEGMVLPAENTITKAYKAFCVLTGMDCGCTVKVKKRIPAGGGLGGGSSDASSFLKSIDTLCGTQLTAQEFDTLCASVGSDVFFFMHALLSGARPFAALVGGRGEQIEPLVPRSDFCVLLVFPGVSVSTKEAYALLDDWMALHPPSHTAPAEVRSALQLQFMQPVEHWSFQNDFTAPVAAHHPRIQKALAVARECGAVYANMSGSGATVFGIFTQKKEALKAQTKMAGQWQTVLVV